MNFQFLVILLALFISSCNYQNNPIKNIDAQSNITSLTSSISWEANIKPIFENNCFSCHANGATKFSDYESVRGNFTKIYETIESGKMPMGGNKLDMNKISLLKQWEAQGFPQISELPQSDTITNPDNQDNQSPTAFSAKEEIEKNCVSCHQSEIVGIPNIYSLPVNYLLTEMKHYRDGNRQDNVMYSMNSLLQDYNDEQLSQIAQELSQTDQCKSRSHNSTANEQDIKRGAMLFKFKCASCHTGAGTSAFPWVIGQDQDYLLNTMLEFIKNESPRPSTQMKAYLQNLSQQDIKSIATYLAQEKNCEKR